MSFDLQSFVTNTLPQIVTVASVVSAVLPAPNPGSFGAMIVGLINLLGVNVGHAANATPAALKSEHNNTGAVQS